MAQPQFIEVKLSRFDAQPWGFRLQGGVDFAAPLLVQKVNGGSLAEQAGLMPGDAVIKINDVDVFNLRHKDAQDIVVRSGNNFVITVQRGGSTWRPHVAPTGHLPQPNQNSPYLQTVTKTSLAHKQQESQHIGCGYNNAARPFVNGGDGNVKSIVNKQYNTPVGIYSEESIAETLSAQAEVLAGGVLGVNFKKNEKEYQPDKSEVLKFLREEETGQSSTPEPHSPATFYWTQSHARAPQPIQYQQQHQQHYQQQQQQQQLQQQQQQKQSQQQNERIGTTLQQHTLASSALNCPSLPEAPTTTAAKGTTEASTLSTALSEPASDPRAIIIPVCPALQGPEYKAEMEAIAKTMGHDDDGGSRPTSVSGHPPCSMCGVGIVGVFVRIKDKNLHVECFKCATCGSSLKNQGYYNFNNKLYCDIHAKLAAQQNPPPGTDGYVPVPIKPHTKLSVNTITQALSSHGYNGVSNGSSTPTPAPIIANINDLPLPPPPSPTQLQQFETENQQLYEPNNNHTRPHGSLSSLSSHSNTSSMSPTGGAIEIAFTHNNAGSTPSTLSLEGLNSPAHSRQASSSSSLGGSGSGSGNGCTALGNIPLPPPPPPMPTTFNAETTLYINPKKQNEQSNDAEMLTQHFLAKQQNENDMNTKNIKHFRLTPTTTPTQAPAQTQLQTNDAYNNLLKEYSNKLLTQNNNSDTTDHKNNNKSSEQNSIKKKFNGTAEPFAPSSKPSTTHTPTPTPTKTQSATTTQTPPLSNVAAVSAALANRLKFNPCQVANPLATPTTTTVDNSSGNLYNIHNNNTNINQNNRAANMASIVATEQQIYGQINTDTNSNINQSETTGDQPFEYVTLTGNVIRSVLPPGKGVNINYKVNQGYARPYGASQQAPPAAAPKSPISYPPQQQWGGAAPQQQQQQPQQYQQPSKPAGNPYATLPRTSVGGQQETSCNNNIVASYHSQKDLCNDDATTMLTDSISKINTGDKMNNFMAEAGKIISNMLEARLVNNSQNQSPLSNSGSSLSLRSNSSSNLARSPMLMRKRFELEDFKDIDPTEPVSMSVVTLNTASSSQKAQPQIQKTIGTLTTDFQTSHPMGKVLDICDNKLNINDGPKSTEDDICTKKNQLLPPVISFGELPQASISATQKTPVVNPTNNELTSQPTETFIHQNIETDQVKRRPGGRGGELSTHAFDRRSYIEPNTQPDDNKEPAFSISVKALGPKADSNAPISPENEEVVNQLLKDGKRPICSQCNIEITKGPFITALGRIWCPDHFICVNANCRRALQDIGFVEEKGDLYCEYCFEKYLAPTCSKCAGKIKGDCLNAIGRHFHPECFTCGHCGKIFGNTPFFLEDGNAYCEADWNELFTTKCFACGFPVEAGDRWVEALNHNYHSQCFNCTYCKANLEGQSFYNKGGRPFCKNHAR